MHSVACSLRRRADAMQPRIEAKLNPAVARQNLTRRRLGIIGSMRAEGVQMQRVQSVLRYLADRWEADPEKMQKDPLGRLRSAAVVADVLNQWVRWKPEERVAKAGIAPNVLPCLRELLTTVADHGVSSESAAALTLRQREESLVGQKIPGFFPTPKPVIEKMLELLETSLGLDRLESGRVLEPSAGKGDIAEVLRERYAESDLTLCEISNQLCDILEMKGFKPRRGSFLDMASSEGTFDAIVMNPPFEKTADIQHVTHAYGLLASGGVLVSVMAAGVSFRNDKRTEEFRALVESVGGAFTKVDGPAFSKGFVSTSVQTVIVVMRKP